MKLNLGCGVEVIDRPGWVNGDLEPRHSLARKMDALNLPYETGTVDLVISSHLLEHLPAEQALLEWKRVLKVGGECVACIPDLDHKAQWIAFHLAEASERGGGEAHRHISEMSAAQLVAAFKEAGFTDVESIDPGERWELPSKAWWQAVVKGVKS